MRRRTVSRKDIEDLKSRIKPASEKTRVVWVWPDQLPDDYEPGPDDIVLRWPDEPDTDARRATGDD